MKKCTISGRIALSLFALASNVGCSDVSFSPAGPVGGTEINSPSRTKLRESFTQGLTNNKLDLLFVVDNSGSMAPEQAKLAQRIASFLTNLYDVDWQIGITTSDVSDAVDNPSAKRGELISFSNSNYILSSSTPNYEAEFQRTIVRPEQGSGLEQPLKAASLAIEKRFTQNKGFFRDGADLGVLVLTDENEMSSAGMDPNDTAAAPDLLPFIQTPENLVTQFQNAFGTTRQIYGFGIIIQPGDQICLADQNSQLSSGSSYEGTYVQQFADITGGQTGSICDSDYGTNLGKIGDLARRLLNYVQVLEAPRPETVEITFDPAHTTTWTVKDKRIYFDNPPPKGTAITVDYLPL